MLTSRELFEMSQVDIDNIEPSILTDIETISISQALPHEEKVLSFIERIGNPYCFMSGDIPVRIRFVGKGKYLSESLINYFSQLKQQ